MKSVVRQRFSCLVGLALVLGFGGGASRARAGEMSDRFPEGTLLYVGWPGMEAMSATFGETALAKTMREPELVKLREAFWPAVGPLLREAILSEGEIDEAGYEAITGLLKSLWKYPVAVGVVGVEMAPEGPALHMGHVVRAGAEATQVSQQFEQMLIAAGVPVEEATEAKIGTWTVREVPPPVPGMLLRWGVIEEDFILSVGTRWAEHLAAGPDAATLTTSERFKAAMEVTGGSGATPAMFIDLEGIVKTLETFQPMFAGLELPVLGEEGGVRRVLESVGLGSARSMSIACRLEAGGFMTTAFLHAPEMGEGASAVFAQKPLTDADLAVVPVDATWMTVFNFDLRAFYVGVLNSVEKLSPDAHGFVTAMIGQFEQQIGMSIADDLLGAFEDTWAIYDAPSQGGVLFTGITLVAEVKAGNRIDEMIGRLCEMVAGMAGSPEAVSLHTETYRGATITFVNVSGVPMPIAPAWAQYKGRLIAALFPQMVRPALDRLMDQGESILDNADFQRGRKLLPAGAHSVRYADTAKTVRFVYPLVMPVAQMLIAMGQGEGLALDASVLPSTRTLTKHLFGTVGASAKTDQGLVTVYHGPLPLSSDGAVMLPLMASIAIPAMIAGREQAMMMAAEGEGAAGSPAPLAPPAPGAGQTRGMISPGGPLATQLELYKQHVGHYPKNLDELFTEPEDERDAIKWGGPYIEGLDTLEDEWGNALQYTAPGVHKKNGYDLWSVGPDGEDGTGDDLTNWAE